MTSWVRPVAPSRSLASRAACALIVAVSGYLTPQALALPSRASTPYSSRLHSVWIAPQGALARARGLYSGGTTTLGAFRLPNGVRQGSPLWYVIHIQAALVLQPGHAECELSAATDGATAAQIIVRTFGRRTIISTDGWIQGASDTRIRSRRYEVDYWNYLQLHGVRRGTNVVTVTVRDLSGNEKCLRAIKLGRGTGVFGTRSNPRELQLLVPRDAVNATAGSSLTIPFEVVRRGGWPDRGATVVLDLPEGWRALDGARRTFTRIGSRRDGSFRVIATAPGSQILTLAVARSYNRPEAAVRVVVRPAGGWFPGRIAILVSAGFIVLAAAMTRAAWRDRRRHRERRGSQSLPKSKTSA